MDLLVAWLGNTDLKAAQGDVEAAGGPIASATSATRPDEIVILSGHSLEEGKAYVAWLRRRTRARVVLQEVQLRSPTDFGDIHRGATQAIGDALARHPSGARLTLHLSGGTPAMAAIFLLLGKTRYPARFLESSRAYGVREVEVPFSLSAEFLPDLLRGPDATLAELASELPPAAPEFGELVHRCEVMRRLVLRARRVALRQVPVLIEGESGTGKELLARALHHGGPRKQEPFVAVNCGAIPDQLVESELFGHEKGAFTGALHARRGHFREAHGGTLFLDEVSELPRAAQVKLLRALQQREVVPVGASRPVPIDVRVVAASNRNVLRAVVEGHFRSDLYYRLAVAVLVLPPLREREGDLDLLIDHALTQLNRELASDPGFEAIRLAPAARSALHAHTWPGNVRELWSTLRRAALWSSRAAIDAADAREAILPVEGRGVEKPVGDGAVNLPEVLADVARQHLRRALDACSGNKSRAAARLGLASHQTLTNWMDRYGVT
ncbi:MAG TPA: sigma-54 dependent transcriptional regulator [Polyangiaceae bacterium]|jgi:DNA-binding NtrC family response regulator